MRARRMLHVLAAGLTIALAGPALGQGKLVVYTSNDSNLNRFVFDAFTKETAALLPSASIRSATSSGA